MRPGVERSGWQVPAAGVGLFLLNAYISFNLFGTEFHQHLSSVEGLFIGITRFAMNNLSDLTWLPLWLMGMPFHHVYPPGVHVSAAVLANAMHWSPAHAWHFVIASLYCLGPAFLFWTALQFNGRFGAALSAGLLWTVFSPSCLLVPAIWRDTGEMISNRRLHNVIAWGEGPNAVTLGIVILAIGLLHLALTRGKAFHYAGAVLAMAAVPLCSWPATMALVIALGCYIASREPNQWRHMFVPALAIGGFAGVLVLPWIPPSTILATSARAQFMQDAVKSEGTLQRGAAAAGVVLLVAALWFLSRRLRFPVGLRFGLYYFAVTGAITLIAANGGPSLLPQAVRFHEAMEIGFILALVFGASLLLDNRPRLGYAVFAALLLFTIRQSVLARNYTDADIGSLAIDSTIEYRTANWLAANMPGERVFATGSIEFWMNAFTLTPQLGGCCDQAITNPVMDIARYVLRAGDETAGHSGDLEVRLLWMKALGIHAAVVGGPQSREVYKSIQRPAATIQALPVAWHDGDDFICLIPARSRSLAHVMRAADLPARPPVNGLDLEPLRPYVRALDDPTYPLADLTWLNQHSAKLHVDLKPEQIISLQISYWKGWHATANGSPIGIREDNLGLLYLQPNCSGPCDIQLTYDGGSEHTILAWLRVIGMGCGVLAMIWVSRRQSRGTPAAR